jgi:hypothetical protein
MTVKGDGTSDTDWELVRTQYAGCCEVILLFLGAVHPERLFSPP